MIVQGGASLNQYARSGGHIKLTQTLANMYGPLFGRTINPMDEIVTTVGASEGKALLQTQNAAGSRSKSFYRAIFYNPSSCRTW